MKKQLLTILTLAIFAIPMMVQAAAENSVVGAQGYDLVSYHSGEPAKGDGNNVATHEGVNYLFANAENKAEFEANPAKYVPAYGGYCAYGVSVGKKFIADPLVYEVVDGTLYLNLDKKVQDIWSQDIPGNIEKANTQWPEIESKDPSEL